MGTRTLNVPRRAEEAVTKLVEECRKGGPLYPKNPKAAAQVSRTSKWLLYAITALHKELTTPSTDTDTPAS